VARRVLLDHRSLTLEAVGLVADGGARVSLSPRSLRRMNAARAVVQRALADDRPTYGVNTGFGHLSDVRIPLAQVRALQVNLIRSHAAGVGEPLGPGETRAAMLLRAHVLAQGHSGTRPLVARRLLAMLNADILPVIPCQGSVGASGDLAPLAHLALGLIGEGEVQVRGRRQPASRALAAAGIPPVRLEAKEGLSLINGTQIMTAIGALALLEAESLLVHGDIAGAMSLEALRGSAKPFDQRIHDVRPHAGQAASARNLRRLLARSAIMESHRDCARIQDSYALRCMPQVHGAARAAAGAARAVLAVEINAATDNPLVFPEAGAAGRRGAGTMIPGGNFHGQPVAVALDALALALVGFASISERRIDRLVNPLVSELPAFLVPDVGLNSGFMLAQVTAAALVSESKALSHPASVDSIPTSANKEDHVSMGPIAARKAAAIVTNLRRVLAIEILAAAQALDFLTPLRPAAAVAAVRDRVRRDVPFMKRDRVLARDIATVESLILSGALRGAAESEAGRLA